MDCNQRIAFLLFGALILCAVEGDNSFAQEGEFSGRPGVNTPTTLSEIVPPRSVGENPRGNPADSENPRNVDPSQFASGPGQQTATTAPRTVTPLKRSSGLPSGNDAGSASKDAGSSSAGAFLTALVVVLLFVLGLAKLFLKRSPYSISGLPTDAVDVLGRRAVDPRNSVYMIKVGGRLILMGSSPNGLSSLAEITDPIEVASLTNVCAAAKQTGPDAAKWLGKLWPKTTTVVESRPFDDQLGKKLFEEAQRDESGRVDSLTIATGQERHRAG
jgi:flagellar biogenesis protein FliO